MAGLDKQSGETIVKVVNSSERALETQIDLKGARSVAMQGKALVLSGPTGEAENSFDAKTHIAPREHTIKVPATTFSHTFPAQSVTVLRLKANV